MRGRKPKPTAMKIAQGNPGKRPINSREPAVSPGIPSCPSHLGGPAREEWDRITGELSKIGLLTQVDRAALAAYCASYARWVEAETLCSRGVVYQAKKKTKGADGTTTEESSGLIKINPAVKVAHDAMAMMLRYLTEFGLSPASRSRIHVGEASPEDQFERDFPLTG